MRIHIQFKGTCPQGEGSGSIEFETTPEEHIAIVKAYAQLAPELLKAVVEALNTSNERPIFN